jgi:hypothetical protein
MIIEDQIVILRYFAGIGKTMKQETIKSILTSEQWLLFRIFTAGKQGYFKGNEVHYYIEDFKKFCKVHKIKGA